MKSRLRFIGLLCLALTTAAPRLASAAQQDDTTRIRELLNERIASGELVAIELAGENPWLKYAGWAKDDPYYHIYLEELAKEKVS